MRSTENAWLLTMRFQWSKSKARSLHTQTYLHNEMAAELRSEGTLKKLIDKNLKL